MVSTLTWNETLQSQAPPPGAQQVVNVLLDTHVWVWWRADRTKLSRAATQWFEKGEFEVAYLSMLSCWEVSKLVEKGKLNFTIPLLDWVNQAVQLPGLTVVDLDAEISVASTQLPEPFRDDPADQIIVATARKLQVPIVTADKRLRAYPHVRTLW